MVLPVEEGQADDEHHEAGRERDDVIDGQVDRRMSVALVARAPVAVLAAPGAEHAGAEALPRPGAVEGVVPAAVGLPGVLEAAATRAAGDDTTDRAELHSSCRPSVATRLTLVTVDCASFDIAMSVAETDVRVYSPTVLRRGSQPGHMAPIRRD